MQIPVERWHEAIAKRRSRRQFFGQSLTREHLYHLKEFITEINSTSQGYRAALVLDSPEDVFKGGIGSYGKIKDAPAYIAFVGDMTNPNVQELTGYFGEAVILEATALGLATCWVGGFFKPGVVSKEIVIAGDEKVLAVTPVGYARKEYTFEEKIMSGFAVSHKRKELQNLVSGDEPSGWSLWIKKGLEAARLAPSAVNRQPWRFHVENSGVRLYLDKPQDTYKISKRLDCGIAMLHFEIGALHAGTKGSWEYLPSPDVARFKLD
ncbi:MAG: nitroreductase family protein [Bacillota bacterium]